MAEAVSGTIRSFLSLIAYCPKKVHWLTHIFQVTPPANHTMYQHNDTLPFKVICSIRRTLGPGECISDEIYKMGLGDVSVAEGTHGDESKPGSSGFVRSY